MGNANRRNCPGKMTAIKAELTSVCGVSVFIHWDSLRILSIYFAKAFEKTSPPLPQFETVCNNSLPRPACFSSSFKEIAIMLVVCA